MRWARAGARRLFKLSVARSRVVRALAARLPFSRFAPALRPLFGGSERTVWRGANLSVDPGELEGYYRYFLPDAPDPEYDFLADACRNASIFFDVGANQGLYSLALATAYPDLQVVAFEPDHRLVASINANRRLNPSLETRVAVEKAAVSDRSEFVRFMTAPGVNSGTGRIANEPSRSTVEVRGVALDDYIRDTGLRPDVIKIDVEGAEREVLRGMRQSANVPRAILVELHPHNFDGVERERYQRDMVGIFTSMPLTWRFLVGETAWADTLNPSAAWISRIHAFGTRT